MPDIQIARLHSRAPAGSFWLKCCQFAWTRENDGIALVSVCGPQTAVKSLMAALNQNGKLSVQLHDAIDQDGDEIGSWRNFVRQGTQGSYAIKTHRLGYHWVHATAILKNDNLLPCLTPEAVWRVLSGTRFTTPLLKEWMPWLLREMEENRLLTKIDAFQCQPGMLLVDEPRLDELVERGLKRGDLKIPGKVASCAK